MASRCASVSRKAKTTWGSLGAFCFLGFGSFPAVSFFRVGCFTAFAFGVLLVLGFMGPSF